MLLYDGKKFRRFKCADLPDEELLDAIRNYHARHAPMPHIALAHKYPVKVILAKLDKLCRKNIIDYGVSLCTAFIIAETDGANDAEQ